MFKNIPGTLKEVLPLTIPILAEQALIVSMTALNAAMAANVSKEAASAIGMVDAITWVLIAFFNSLALGGTVLVAQRWGKHDRDGAEQAAAQAIMACVALGIALGALSSSLAGPIIRLLYNQADAEVERQAVAYLGITALGYPFLAATLTSSGALRGAGDTRTPMFVNVAMTAVSVATSALLIFGFEFPALGMKIPALGVAGAAVGITIARAFGTAAYAALFFGGSLRLKLRKARRFRPDPRTLAQVFAVGIPSGVESLTFNGGKLLTQTYIVLLGTDSVAANYIASSITSFLQVPGTSFSLAATTLVGQAVGRDDFAAAKRRLYAVTALSSLSYLVVGLPGIFFVEQLSRLYTRDPAVVALSVNLLRFIFIVSPAFWSVSFIIPSGLRGAGDVRFPMVVAMISMWTIRVSLGYVFALPCGWGVLGVWIAMTIDWVIRAAFFIPRAMGNKWNKKLAA